MGGAPQELTGPDFKKGLPLESVQDGDRVLGHADGVPVLLIRSGSEFFAVGATCTHYGAPLAEGIVTEKTIRCPWHHACFNLKTGEASKAPAFHALATWNTEVKEGMVYVRDQRPATTKPRTQKTKEHFVIVGAGAAGFAAAERLRREGFGGAITMISEDVDPPYDRPNLSKDYLAGNAPEEWIPLCPPEFFKESEISLRLNTRVTSLDPRAQTLRLDGGETLSFDKCLLATGGRPNRPPLEGIERKHVHFLRTFADCKRLVGSLKDVQRVAILGSGFIGLEGAAALKSRGLDVTVIDPKGPPLARVVGEDVGRFLQSVHEKNGVRFYLGRTVKRIEDQYIELDDRARLEANLVLVAVGIQPDITLAQSAGLECDNGILVNEYMETSHTGIFAAGDVARSPSHLPGAARTRVEHWVVAQRQGQSAALNMLGHRSEYREVPFFWSHQFDVTLGYIGHAANVTKTEMFGSLASRNCAVAYYDGDRIAAVLTMGRDQDSLRIEQLMEKRDWAGIRSILQSEH